MTPDEIRNLEGPELAAAVAEKVMGWKRHPWLRGWWIKPNGDGHASAMWRPYRSIADAMEALDHAKSQWPQDIGKPAKFVRMVSERDGGWCVIVIEENSSYVMTLVREMAPTLPLAICRALVALAELEGES